MKTILQRGFAAFFLLLFHNLLAQAPIIDWTKTFGGTGIDKASAIRPTSDGGFIVVGISYSINGDVTGSTNEQGNMWVVKLSANGTLQWQKSLGGSLEDGAESVRQTSDGGYIVVGFAKSVDGDVVGNHGTGDTDDAWVVKLNSSGAIVWQKCYGGVGFDVAYDVVQTTDGGYAICGSSGTNSGDVTDNNGGYDFWLIKINATGTIQWSQSYGGTSNDIGRSLRQTADGGYIMCGSTSSSNLDVVGNHGGSDMWVVKTSSTGTLQWQNPLGGTSSEVGYAIERTPDGGYVVAGIALSNNQNVGGNHGGNDAWVVKLSVDGTIQWQRCLGGTSYEIAQSVDVTELGEVVVVGQANSSNGNVTGHLGGGDFWIVQLTTAGVVQWQKCFGGTGLDWAYGLRATGSGSFIVCGVTESSDINVPDNSGARDFFIAKLLPDPLSVPEENVGLFQVVTHALQDVISVRIPGYLVGENIDIFNVKGVQVLRAQLTATDNTISTEALPSGVYLVKVGNQIKDVARFIKN